MIEWKFCPNWDIQGWVKIKSKRYGWVDIVKHISVDIVKHVWVDEWRYARAMFVSRPRDSCWLCWVFGQPTAYPPRHLGIWATCSLPTKTFGHLGNLQPTRVGILVFGQPAAYQPTSTKAFGLLGNLQPSNQPFGHLGNPQATHKGNWAAYNLPTKAFGQLKTYQLRHFGIRAICSLLGHLPTHQGIWAFGQPKPVDTPRHSVSCQSSHVLDAFENITYNLTREKILGSGQRLIFPTTSLQKLRGWIEMWLLTGGMQ